MARRKKRGRDDAGDLLSRGRALVDDDNREAERLLRRALPLLTNPAHQGECHDALGIVRRREGDNDGAMSFFRDAIDAHHRAKNPDGEARALVHLAGVEIDTILPAEALTHLREAFAIAKAAANATLEAHVADILSYALEAQGFHDEAREVGQYGLDRLEKSGNANQLGVSLGNLGVQLQLAGKRKEAEHQYKRALELSERANDLHNAAHVLANLGSLALGQGRFVEAAPFIERAIVYHQKTGNRAGEAHAMLLLADIHSSRGEALQACQLQRDAGALFHVAGNRWMEGIALGNLGNEELGLGLIDRAIGHHRESLELLAKAGQEQSTGSVLTGAALALAEAGRWDEALPAAERACDIFRRARDGRWEGIALITLGLVTRDRKAATETYAKSLVLLEAAEDTPSQSARALACLAAMAFADVRHGDAIGFLDRGVALAESSGDSEAVMLIAELRKVATTGAVGSVPRGATARLLWKAILVRGDTASAR